jgi:hypothetical protein
VWHGVRMAGASVKSGFGVGSIWLDTGLRCKSNGSTAIVQHNFKTRGLQAGVGFTLGMHMTVTNAFNSNALGGGIGSRGSVWSVGKLVAICRMSFVTPGLATFRLPGLQRGISGN